MIPGCHKSSVLLLFYQPGPKQVTDAQLDAFYVISPNEPHGQNYLIGFICCVHYSLNKQALSSHDVPSTVLSAGATNTGKTWLDSPSHGCVCKSFWNQQAMEKTMLYIFLKGAFLIAQKYTQRSKETSLAAKLSASTQQSSLKCTTSHGLWIPGGEKQWE